jgi:hypothetical protein
MTNNRRTFIKNIITTAISIPFLSNIQLGNSMICYNDSIKQLAIKCGFEFHKDKLLAISKEFMCMVDECKSKYTDWSQRDDIKAELKVGLILILDKHGYTADI